MRGGRSGLTNYIQDDEYVINWETATLLNSWVSETPGTRHDPGYAKTPDGWVHLRGVMKNGVDGATAFILPPAFRPAKQCVCPAVAFNGATFVGNALVVRTDGLVMPNGGGATAAVYMDGCSFDTRP